MKNLNSFIFILSCLAMLSFSLSAKELVSPFPTFAPGLSIPNADEVDQAGKIYRGMSPGNLIHELATNQFTDVLIFKRQIEPRLMKNAQPSWP